MTTEKQKERAALKLYKAVADYVKINGGTVLVAGGIQVIQFPEELKGNWSLAVKCTGVMPVYAQKDS